MIRIRMKHAALALLTLTLWGCERAGEVLEPQAFAPSLVVAGFTVLQENAAATGSVSAVIGQDGGTLSLGSQRLTVPAGAVDAPTTFVMSRANSNFLVRLTATRVTTNDVGAAGFAKPLTLTVAYDKAASLPADLSTLRVIWVKQDGTAQAQPTVVDAPGRRVDAQLGHFSDYALARD